MPDDILDKLLTQEEIDSIRMVIGLVLAELPSRRRGVWYRFSFDVVDLDSGARVNHVRLEAIPEGDIYEKLQE